MGFFSKICSAICRSSDSPEPNLSMKNSFKSYLVQKPTLHQKDPQTQSQENSGRNSFNSNKSSKSKGSKLSIDSLLNEQILPPLSYCQEDIQEFSDFISRKVARSSNFNFNRIFLSFRAKNCKN